MGSEGGTDKEHHARRMAQKEAIRQNREAMDVETVCKRRGQQIDAIHDIAKQRI